MVEPTFAPHLVALFFGGYQRLFGTSIPLSETYFHDGVSQKGITCSTINAVLKKHNVEQITFVQAGDGNRGRFEFGLIRIRMSLSPFRLQLTLPRLRAVLFADGKSHVEVTDQPSLISPQYEPLQGSTEAKKLRLKWIGKQFYDDNPLAFSLFGETNSEPIINFSEFLTPLWPELWAVRQGFLLALVSGGKRNGQRA